MLMTRATSKRNGHRAAGSRRATRARTGVSRAKAKELRESAADDVEGARDADAASRLLLAAGVRDMTHADDVKNVANRVGALSQVVALAGARDLAHGADLLEAATDVEIMSALVGTMSRSDLERGMELARLSGEFQAVGRIVKRLQMRILSAYLLDRAVLMSDMAVRTMVRGAGTRALATALAVTGADIGELSASDVAMGITRMAASGAMADASKELAAKSKTEAKAARTELTKARSLREGAREARTEAAAEAMAGAAVVGGTSSSAAQQER